MQNENNGRDTVSLDNITDNTGSGNGENKNDVKRKLDDIFKAEKDDLAWLDSVLNSDFASNKEKESSADESLNKDEASGLQAEDLFAENHSDVKVSAEEVSDEEADESWESDEIPEITSEEAESETVEEVITAENASEEYTDEEDGIFGSESIPEESAPEDKTQAGNSAPSLDMFEGEAEQENVSAEETPSNGVDSSLGKLFGLESEETEQVEKKPAKKKSELNKIAKELGAYEEIDMTDPEAVSTAKSRYFSRKRSSMIALLGTAVCLLISLYFEMSMLGVLPLPELINAKTNPVIFALIDLQIMFFGAMFVLDSLAEGFGAVLDRKFSPASCALTVFAVCTVQAVASAILSSAVKTELFCCVGTLALFMLALYNSLRASSDMKSFDTVSSGANKYGAYSLGTDSLECTPFASHIDSENAKVVSVNKGSFYDGFVGRNEKRPESEKKLGKFALAIGIIAVLAGIFVAIFSDGNAAGRIYDGITGAAIVVSCSIPLNIFFVCELPRYIAVKEGKKIDATLVGRNASEEYKGLSVVVFEDTEVFLPKDVRISSIKTYGGMALDEAVIMMSGIYGKIGGPLSRIFTKMVDIKNLSSDVTLEKVYPDAIEVTADGREVTLATASYLGANGIRIINDSVDASFEQSHGSILFLVSGGRVLAKFYIKYSINPVFEKTLARLHDANLCVGIKTLDPCITNELVFGCLERANYALSVVKGTGASDIPTVQDKVDSGVISLGSVHNFLEMLLICEKTGRNVKINNIIRIISTVLCAGLSTLFVLTNHGSLNIVFCLLLQIFWLLPITAVSYLNK